MIPIPDAAYRYLALAAVVAAALGGSYFAGYSKAEKAALVAEKAASDRHLAEREALELQRRSERMVYDEQLETARARYQTELAAARIDADRARARLAVGTDRLRVPVVSCAPVDRAVPGAPAASGGADGTARAELAPEAATVLHDGLAEGDAAIRQLTALQAWARRAVTFCNGPPS